MAMDDLTPEQAAILSLLDRLDALQSVIDGLQRELAALRFDRGARQAAEVSYRSDFMLPLSSPSKSAPGVLT